MPMAREKTAGKSRSMREVCFRPEMILMIPEEFGSGSPRFQSGGRPHLLCPQFGNDKSGSLTALKRLPVGTAGAFPWCMRKPCSNPDNSRAVFMDAVTLGDLVSFISKPRWVEPLTTSKSGFARECMAHKKAVFLCSSKR